MEPWQLALNEFLSQFIPAKNFADSTHLYTTVQIIKLIDDHSGSHCEANALHVELMNSGFESQAHHDEILWMFKQK